MARGTIPNRAWLVAGLLVFACNLNPQPIIPRDAQVADGGGAGAAAAGTSSTSGMPNIGLGGGQMSDPSEEAGGAAAELPEPGVDASEGGQGGAATGGEGGESNAGQGPAEVP